MKKTSNVITKIISIFLSVVLVVEILPMSVFAEMYKESQPVIKEAAQMDAIGDTNDSPILYEVESKREENKKVFLHKDGSYTDIISSSPLHYKEDGKWKDIDNTLSAKTVNGKSVLENAHNSFDVTLPASITDKEAVTVNKDGYSLSFYMNDISLPFLKSSISGEIAEKAKEDDNASNAQKASKFETKSSEVTYKSVNKNVDLEYTVQPDGLKENIVLDKEPDKGTAFSFTLSDSGLTAAKLDDNSIEFKTAKGDVVFTIPAPFMYDKEYNTSYDIQVSLVSSGNDTYTLSYIPSSEWLDDSGRSYPVVIDPVVRSSSGQTGVDDANYSEANPTTNYGSSTTMLAKREPSNTCRALFKMNDNFYAFNANIRGVTLNVAVKNTYSVNTTLEAQGITATWAENTLNFNNRPAYNSSVLDYNLVTPSTSYSRKSFDITRAFTSAVYSGSEFYGVMLRAMDETTTNGAIIASSEDATNFPYFEINYVETSGLRDIYDYHTQSAGRAGTVYVNDFTGTAYIERDELGIAGNIMPVNIKRYYSNSLANSAVGTLLGITSSYGTFWRMNYNQWIEYSNNYSDGKARFTYIGDKGQVVHYISTTQQDNNQYKWVEETSDNVGDTGTILWAPINFTGTLSDVKIVNADGQTLNFDSNGFLIKITSSVNSSDYITIQYTGVGMNISKIIDGVGREYRFTYHTETNKNPYLESIQCFRDSGNTPIKVKNTAGANVDLKITYNCTSDLLATTFLGATYPDGETVSYQTDTNTGFCTAMNNVDGYRLEFPTNNYGKISSITEKAYNPTTQSYVTGNYINITNQSAYQNTFTDSNGNTEVKQFDKYGRTYCVLDGNGDYVYSTYSDQTIQGKTENLLNKVLDVQTSSMNLIENNSFEVNTTGWTAWSDDGTHQFARSNLYAAVGSYSGKLSRATTGTAALYQDFTSMTIGATYTLSAWVNVPTTITGQGAKVDLQAWNGSTFISETASACVTNTNGQWVRLETTLTVPANTTKLRAHVRMNSSMGTLYADGYQLEKADSAGEYNYVQNPDFTFGTDLWTVVQTGAIVTDTNNNNRAKSLDNNAYQHTGSTTTSPCIWQHVYINGAKDDVFRFGAWAKTASAVALGTDRSFTMLIKDDTGGNLKRIDFNPNSINTWQFMQDTFKLGRNTAYVDIFLSFNNQIGSAMFDGIQLYKGDNPGETVDPPTNDDPNTYVKDSHGNITQTTLTKGTKSEVTSSTYSSTGNYQASSVDENGNPVYYTNDESNDNGQLMTVAAGNQNQTVSYGYTAMGALKSVSQAVSNLSNGSTISSQYSYTHDRISSVTHNGFSYNFTYDIWGNQTEVKVGNQSLVAYSYTQDNSRNLNTVTYGNGNTISYTYSNGNVTGISYNGGSTFAYTYAYTDGVLSTLTDNISGTVTNYVNGGYEIRKQSDNSLIYSSSGGTEVFNGVTYTNSSDESDPDSQGVTTATSTVTSSNVSLEADRVTDGFSRINSRTFKHKNSSGTTLGSLTANSYYEDDAFLSSLGMTPETNVSTQVGAYSSQYTANNQVTAKNTYKYEYDNKGNITRIYDVTYNVNGNPVITDKYRYAYDEASQIVREDNAMTNETYSYTYDVGGNITNKTVYTYTLGTPTTVKSSTTYTYGNANWKDLLTSISGYNVVNGVQVPFTTSTIGYDNSQTPTLGNPTTYRDGSTLTWQGRQLMSYTKAGTKYAYTYNDEGLRTSQKFYDSNNVLQKTYQYVWKNGALAAQIMTASGSTTTVKYIYDGNGEPQGFIYNGTQIIYYMKDAQGDVTALIDSGTGNVVATYLYDAWGNVTYSATNSVGTTMLAANAITYRGYCFDMDSGLYYLQSRYYDSTTSRFLNADDPSMLRFIQGEVLETNQFAYCSNNPVMRIDSSGYRDYATIYTNMDGIGLLAKWLCINLIAICVHIAALSVDFPAIITILFHLVGTSINSYKVCYLVVALCNAIVYYHRYRKYTIHDTLWWGLTLYTWVTR